MCDAVPCVGVGDGRRSEGGWSTAVGVVVSTKSEKWGKFCKHVGGGDLVPVVFSVHPPPPSCQVRPCPDLAMWLVVGEATGTAVPIAYHKVTYSKLSARPCPGRAMWLAVGCCLLGDAARPYMPTSHDATITAVVGHCRGIVGEAIRPCPC